MDWDSCKLVRHNTYRCAALTSGRSRARISKLIKKICVGSARKQECELHSLWHTVAVFPSPWENCEGLWIREAEECWTFVNIYSMQHRLRQTRGPDKLLSDGCIVSADISLCLAVLGCCDSPSHFTSQAPIKLSQNRLPHCPRLVRFLCVVTVIVL